MKKSFILILFLLGITTVQAASPAIDGTNSVTNFTNANLVTTITTTNLNDIIIAVVMTNGGSVLNITDASGLTWRKRKRVVQSANLEEWWAQSTAILVADTVTVAVTSDVASSRLMVTGISGANFTAPFDPNLIVGSYITSGSTALNITTTQADDLILGFYRFGSTNAPTHGTGFTDIIAPGTTFQLWEYKSVSATQSGLSVAIGTGASDVTGGIIDAITSDASITVENSSKINSYSILNVGTNSAASTSKINGYDILNAGTASAMSMSKTNTYIILKALQTPSLSRPFHSFPP